MVSTVECVVVVIVVPALLQIGIRCLAMHAHCRYIIQLLYLYVRAKVVFVVPRGEQILGFVDFRWRLK